MSKKAPSKKPAQESRPPVQKKPEVLKIIHRGFVSIGVSACTESPHLPRTVAMVCIEHHLMIIKPEQLKNYQCNRGERPKWLPRQIRSAICIDDGLPAKRFIQNTQEVVLHSGPDNNILLNGTQGSSAEIYEGSYLEVRQKIEDHLAIFMQGLTLKTHWQYGGLLIWDKKTNGFRPLEDHFTPEAMKVRVRKQPVK